MENNREPYACSNCGTVNAWNQEVCRDCKTPREKNTVYLESADDDTVDSLESSKANDLDIQENELHSETLLSEPPSSPKRRWNAFWIFFGIAVHVVFIQLSVLSVTKFFIEPDQELKSTIERTLEAAKNGSAEKASILDSLPEHVKSKLLSIRTLLILILVSAPLLIGGVTGFFSHTVLEGAASMGLSAVLLPVLNGSAELAILWGPINAGLGALGAYLGCRLVNYLKKQRISDSSPKSLA